MSAPTLRTFRLANWTLRPDRDEDAPPTTYAFRCLALGGDGAACAAQSPPSEEPTEPQKTVFDHLREHPEHTSFAEIIERPWVMWLEGPA
ncbi:DUF7848 domain-containing protein [Streptomyces reticuli]|uniref:DUF7848 domain-containing protein n=1 Tax=Streptomyces reticuli TaxID=1926 RepID=UPI00073DD855|nr:hypothetical protein [Streptomyces sp. SID7810]CUW30642.1 hypothetical protein TUE45_05376 [Streptomyces reticuli]